MKWIVNTDLKLNAAFTIFELLLAIAIVTILFVGSLPMLRHLLLNNRETVVVNSIVSTLQFAKSEAIKRGVSISVHKDSKGRFVVAKVNGEILRVLPALRSNESLIWRGNFGQDSLHFSSLGGATNGSFVYQSADDSQKARVIVVSTTGRIRK